MGDYHTEYSGSDNGLDPDYSGSAQYRISAGQIGFSTDPRTAAQLKAVSEKLSTGAKHVEVSLVSPKVFEAIPKEHFKELERLKNLVGAELTLHAPVIEPTGVSKQGWNESDRQQAETQMWSSIKSGHQIDPKGNLVITFHSSAALPEPETKVINEKTGKEEIKEVWFVNERTGQFGSLPVKPQYLEGEEATPQKILRDSDRQNWSSALQHASYWANIGADHLEKGESLIKTEGKQVSSDVVDKEYKRFVEGKLDWNEIKDKEIQEALREKFNEKEQGEIYVRDSYYEMKELFDKAYAVAEKEKNKENLSKLDKFKEQIKPLIPQIRDPSKAKELANSIKEGIHILHSIEAPEMHKPLREFAIDKASETFSNLAFKSYKEFEKGGNHSPIISIENPPAGGALSRAEDLKKVIEEAREKFVHRATTELNLSKEEAKKQAEKLIGATWDVGHINMLRKFGYGEKEIIKEAEKIAPFVKHVHLSDNFGMEHTELPMGMGNVPTGKILEILNKYNKKLKKIAETGDWYEHFKSTPFAETLSYFNSPIYGAQASPYWSEKEGTVGRMGGYSSVQTNMPDIHYSTFGAGFSGLPSSLGGQTGRSRLSGAPID